MRNAIIGIVIGVVVGVALGAAVIAPRLAPVSSQVKAEETDGVPLTTGLLPSSPPAAVRWKMASAYASSLMQSGASAKRVETNVWRVSGGDVEIRFYEPGVLASRQEMFDAVASGAIEAAFSSPSFWGARIPALNLFSAVPFGPAAEEYLSWFYSGGGRSQFESLYHKNGIHSILCGAVFPDASGWFRKEIRTVGDLKGITMHIEGLGAKVMDRLGVKTKQLSGGDIFAAFETGAIDAAEFSMPAIDLELGFYKLAKHYYMPGWRQPITLLDLMINLERWESLTIAQQSQIEAVCGDNIRFGLAEGRVLQYPALKKMVANGVFLHRWPGEIMKALNKAWQETAAKEAESDIGFRRVWMSLVAFRRDYAVWDEMGVP